MLLDLSMTSSTLAALKVASTEVTPHSSNPAKRSQPATVEAGAWPAAPATSLGRPSPRFRSTLPPVPPLPPMATESTFEPWPLHAPNRPSKSARRLSKQAPEIECMMVWSTAEFAWSELVVGRHAALTFILDVRDGPLGTGAVAGGRVEAVAAFFNHARRAIGSVPVRRAGLGFDVDGVGAGHRRGGMHLGNVSAAEALAFEGRKIDPDLVHHTIVPIRCAGVGSEVVVRRWRVGDLAVAAAVEIAVDGRCHGNDRRSVAFDHFAFAAADAERAIAARRVGLLRDVVHVEVEHRVTFAVDQHQLHVVAADKVVERMSRLGRHAAHR